MEKFVVNSKFIRAVLKLLVDYLRRLKHFLKGVIMFLHQIVGNRMCINGDYYHPSNDFASRKGDEITMMKQGEQTTGLQSHESNYESEFISFMVSRNKDEITEMKQGERGEQTANLESHKNDESVNTEGKLKTLTDEISKVKQGDTSEQTAKLQSQQSDEYVKAEDSVQGSINLVTSRGDETTGIKQGDPGEQTAELQSHTNDESVNAEESGKSKQNPDPIRFGPLLRAVLDNDWKGVEEFITEDPQVLSTRIKIWQLEETVFHILARKLDTPSWLMEKLSSMITSESLQELKDSNGRPVLYRAAMFGNKKAAEAFVRRNNNLPNIDDGNGFLPIHAAAGYGHKDTAQYLLSVTRVPLDDNRGFQLVILLLEFGLYGIALNLLKRYPNLARDEKDRGNIIKLLASKPQAFESGSRLGYWKRIIYHWIPVEEEYSPQAGNVDGDVENPIVQRSNKLKIFRHFGSIFRQISVAFGALCQKLQIVLWNALVQIVPSIKCIRDTKLMHIHALEIARIMCHERVSWSYEKASHSLGEQILIAASMGICELVHEIMKAYFYSYAFSNEDGHCIFQLAVLSRQVKVFSLVKKMNLCVSDWKGSGGSLKADNILHLAGKLVPSSQVTGAALQMQRELQWFKAVESFVHPSLQEQRNNSNKTPSEVFTDEHKDLVKEGEKWMKDTASSCTVVAALIITVVFAAAFTVPGGNNSGGMPNFLHEPSFIVFVISDALALFSSTTSLLMFLGILTSRYAEQDFLKSLPKKLIFGLITLFFSIASMMVAFGSTVYVFLSQPWKWTIIPISLLGCFPVTLFGLLQFPLLVEIFLSTYRPSISPL